MAKRKVFIETLLGTHFSPLENALFVQHDLEMGEDFSEISYRGFRFLITRCPTDHTMEPYINELKRYATKVVIRVCDPTYDVQPLKKAGIKVFDLSIPDGAFPPERVLEVFFEIVRKQNASNPDSCVAVHCVSGLGRAPVLISAALIELGIAYEDAVAMIRRKRRGAINAKQLDFLSKYKPRHRLRRRRPCVIQ
ncbi:unnamed protein product [Acanthoscelides obtectus]|uniref:Protein tyrosine phosphatase type IVA 3 n=1 Tax=Acanthoscelides obtectus TaxID=200917 RepID=A0A9P0M7H3_ACAOB|nr:unnamed protein product [Acanthoscelides obtectus]CAH2008667.1 unnamed protein product [Acanthoscelides obtectus]CAH2008668.1 unnamed protein product [Acanthoscelides obtectus]CAK1658591.1 Protein tyrosine phosphatase type IVA 3 [Acanthoscelides obtectus]CAK1658592.1 Protein tyrosine phosphatase type IVA 3 [Acanthoscelides obtectus]